MVIYRYRDNNEYGAPAYHLKMKSHYGLKCSTLLKSKINYIIDYPLK